jgi:transposase
VRLYQHPPVNTHVLCVDEMGPTAAKTYPSARWSEQRLPVEADYGRRGKVWTFGAFEPHSGRALTWCAAGRTSANFVDFLDQIMATWTDGDLILILDNLSTHKTLDVLLWSLAHPRLRFLFQPTYSPWLNLIEPWWKTLRSLALKGRSFLDAPQIVQAIHVATEYWNIHAHPFRWRRTF